MRAATPGGDEVTPVGCGPPATRGRYAYFRGDETWPRWLLRPQPPAGQRDAVGEWAEWQL